MGEASAREQRRAMRKLIGDQGRQIVEAQSAVLTEHARTLLQQQTQLDSLRVQQGATFASLAEFCGRNWRGRLRWIVTGK
jgi:hypothetical protein